ncbi:Aerobic respiration control protein ArcA [Candidatus Magnetaquicoccaceae bacterium FCR-1]|uniref:Aerobic respiration control protein ArcA n=1 Tax=Candidatus Magnetaquiglobus chichijimensis TaxID=3141448 RepID=A0ABQ0C5N6_9PROT
MNGAAHLLIVEDDTVTRELLAACFEKEGYAVSRAENGAAMWEILQEQAIDLVLMDINLPDDDGFSLTRALRRRSEIGIILVTARKEDVDRIIGLELGADDYVVKPFNDRELLIRVKNLLRRTRKQRREEDASITRHLFNGWTLDTERRRLTSPEGEVVPLTNGEYLLLSVFVRKPGRVFTRDQLLEAVSSRDWMPSDRTIDVMVNRLRRKLNESAMPRMLVTVHGVGYQFLSERE